MRQRGRERESVRHFRAKSAVPRTKRAVMMGRNESESIISGSSLSLSLPCSYAYLIHVPLRISVRSIPPYACSPYRPDYLPTFAGEPYAPLPVFLFECQTGFPRLTAAVSFCSPPTLSESFASPSSTRPPTAAANRVFPRCQLHLAY